MRNWIYKAERIFEHQDVQKMIGWDAYAPESDEKSVSDHIKYGSSNSRYLSASLSPYVSGQKHCLGSYNCRDSMGLKKVTAKRRHLLLVDWNALDTRTFDCSSKDTLTDELIIETQLVKGSRTVTNASADREIVITDNISPEAGKIIPPILVDVICALDQKRLYDGQDTRVSFMKEHLNRIYSRIDALNHKINSQNDRLEQLLELYIDTEDEKYELQYEECESLINSYKREIDTLKSQSDKLEKDLELIPSEEKEIVNPNKQCINALLDIINEEIFENGAIELLEIIQHINFNEIEKRFIDVYYDGMISMGGTAEILGLDSKHGEMMAAGIRGEIVRKILSNERVQKYLKEKISRKYPEHFENLNKIFSDRKFSSDVIFPLAGEISATSSHADTDGLIIGSNTKTKRNWLPYGVEYTEDGKEVKKVIYKSYSKGKLEDQNNELLVSKYILNALSKGVENDTPISLRITNINRVGFINLSVKELQTYFDEARPYDYFSILSYISNFESLFSNERLDGKLREFLIKLRKLYATHENIVEIDLDKSLLIRKCITNFSFMNEFWDFVNEDVQKQILPKMIGTRNGYEKDGNQNEAKNIENQIIKIFIDNFLDKKKIPKDKKTVLSSTLASTLMTKLPGRENEILRLCIQYRCDPNILSQLIDEIPEEKKAEILNEVFSNIRKGISTTITEKTLFYQALEVKSKELKDSYTSILISNGAEITASCIEGTRKKKEKTYKHLESLKEKIERLHTNGQVKEKQYNNFVRKYFTINDFLIRLNAGDFKFLNAHFKYLDPKMQIRIYKEAEKLNSKEGQEFAERAFATYYCSNGLVPIKRKKLSKEVIEKIIKAESYFEYAKGRTLNYMIENDYDIELIISLIENGSDLDGEVSTKKDGLMGYIITTQSTLYTCMKMKDLEKRKKILTLLLKNGVNINSGKVQYLRDYENDELISTTRENCLDLNNGELVELINELGRKKEISPEQLKKYQKVISNYEMMQKNSNSREVLGKPRSHKELIQTFLKARCSLSESEISALESSFRELNKDLYDETLMSIENLYELAYIYEIIGLDARKFCTFSMLTKMPDVIYSRIRYFMENGIKIDRKRPYASLGLSNFKFFEKYAGKNVISSNYFKKLLKERYPLPTNDEEMLETMKESPVER